MLTQRLGSKTQKDPEFINSLLEIIRDNPGSCDEVWFATDYGFPKLKTHEESANAILPFAEKFCNAGIRVSLQISNTLGHGQYISSTDCSGLVYDGSPVEKLVGADGTVADYCFCWNGKNFREYILASIRPYLAIQPYAVWVDDDFRATNHAPVSAGCFCESCLAKFNSRFGARFTREELVHELDFGDISVRENYVTYLCDSLNDFMREIAKTVHEVSPNSRMGFQHYCNGGYSGRGLGFVFDAMRDETGFAPLSRPGGGAYSDSNPNIFLDKAWDIEWQSYLLPDYVTEIRPEIENLPDVVYGKTIAGTCFETSTYLAYGANAMSYALLMNDYEPMEWHGEMLAAFSRCRPYWKRLALLSSESVGGGLAAVVSDFEWLSSLNRDSKAPNNSLFPWRVESFRGYNKLCRTAIPVVLRKKSTVNEMNAPVYIVHPRSAELMTDEEIEFLMDKAVITDGETLKIFTDRGFAFSASSRYVDTSMLYERFTEHSVNAGFSGRSWSQSFYIKDGFIVSGACEPLGIYETNSKCCPKTEDGEYPYGIANAVVTTSKGSRWAVFGHTPWNEIISTNKRNQILQAADNISGCRLPAILETPQQAVLLPRENLKGQTVGVTIINCTVGKSAPLRLRIRRPVSENFSYMCCGMTQPISLDYVKENDDYIVSVPQIDAWSTGTVFVENKEEELDDA